MFIGIILCVNINVKYKNYNITHDENHVYVFSSDSFSRNFTYDHIVILFCKIWTYGTYHSH